MARMKTTIQRLRRSEARTNKMRQKLVITFAFTALALTLVSQTQGGPVDVNGNALPDANDGKTVIDNSKEKEVSPVVQQGCIAPKDTEFRIGLPGWMAGLSGDVGVRGFVTEQDVSFTKILKHLDMIASSSLYARYHRWEFFADGLYLKVSDTADLRGILFDSARVSLKQAFAESFIGYRLINCEDGFLSVFAGDRWNYMQGDLRLFRGRRRIAGRHVAGEIDWVDPAIGARGRRKLWKAVSLQAKGDVGGFGVASDLAWQVEGGLEVQLTRWIYSDIGWRYMKFDYTCGGVTNKTDLNGPYIETGFNF